MIFNVYPRCTLASVTRFPISVRRFTFFFSLAALPNARSRNSPLYFRITRCIYSAICGQSIDGCAGLSGCIIPPSATSGTVFTRKSAKYHGASISSRLEFTPATLFTKSNENSYTRTDDVNDGASTCSRRPSTMREKNI